MTTTVTGEGMDGGVGEIALPETFAAVAAVAREGLTSPRKRLPAWLLYDERGSALFEEITRLPEYYLTRTERAILEASADEILSAAGQPLEIVELGAGSATKTSLLLAALLARQPHATYTPVDVSPTALGLAAAELRRFRRLRVRPIAARYPEELELPARTASRRLVLFLGSNIGNFTPGAAREFLARIRRTLRAGDALLLGADLIKPERDLLFAYDDPLNVTAAFNRNLLRRINDELGGNFDLQAFTHRVCWNAVDQRMEAFLVSLRRQHIVIAEAQLEIDLAEGESIWTESSHKYHAEQLIAEGLAAGFTGGEQWIDQDASFALTRFDVA
jgi:dimethylhistidine N-methyltransferase